MASVIFRRGTNRLPSNNNLVQQLQTVYPGTYQALIAQGLTAEQIEVERTNAILVQAILDARQNVPEAQKMNELYARYQCYQNTDDTSKFKKASAALHHLLFQKAHISGPITDFVLLHKTFDGDDAWTAFTEALSVETQSRGCIYPNLTRLVEEFVQENATVLHTEFQKLMARNLTEKTFNAFLSNTHGGGSWDSFCHMNVTEMQKKFQRLASVESEAKTLFEDVRNVYEANPDHFKGLATTYTSMRKYQKENNCTILEDTTIWYVEDGFIIRVYDERFLNYTIKSRVSPIFGYTEECQFAAYVNTDIEQNLSTPEMRDDYLRMMDSINNGSPYCGNPIPLQEFLQKYPNL